MVVDAVATTIIVIVLFLLLSVLWLFLLLSVLWLFLLLSVWWLFIFLLLDFFVRSKQGEAPVVPVRDRERRSTMVVGQRRRDRGEVLLLHQMQQRTLYFERRPSTVVHGRDGLYPNRNGTSARFLF